jgi:hypothetical protein
MKIGNIKKSKDVTIKPKPAPKTSMLLFEILEKKREILENEFPDCRSFAGTKRLTNSIVPRKIGETMSLP